VNAARGHPERLFESMGLPALIIGSCGNFGPAIITVVTGENPAKKYQCGKLANHHR
jgi:hypothetical protein